MNLSKEQFWKTLREPAEKNCDNCKHWVRIQGKVGKGHNICAIEKYRTCNDRVYGSLAKNYWVWNEER